MKNFFDWDYLDNSFDQKDEKGLQNTDHTTGNAFDRISDNPFNQSYRLIMNESEERMIHCVQEDNYLEDQFEAQDLDYLQQQDEKQFKLDSTNDVKSNFQSQNEQIEPAKYENTYFNQLQILSQIPKKKQSELQKEPEIKLSKRWKDKVNQILQQKNIHELSAKHNRNMAKFFVRLFSKYMKSNGEKQLFSSQTQEKVKQILEKNCISLKDLETLFGGECSVISRQFLSRILRTRLRQEVILSQDVQNKAAYLLCSKVYALRCRSKHLISRLQSR